MNVCGIEDQKTRKDEQVVAATERTSDLTRQLLAFSHERIMQTRALDLNDVVVNLAKMLKRIIGEHIHLRYFQAQPLPFVQADLGMLEQVLLNLVVNARDAMPHGSQLVITTTTVKIDTASAPRQLAASPGPFVCLEVTDSGTGIAPEHLPRIFEPFFTTKDRDMRTGLGLATVYGIVRQHQGWISVSSRVGAGTTFTILLPAIPPLAAPAVSPQNEPALRGRH